ncbi:MAG: hypothetical protein JSW33_09370 [bacterium]|nr:MAG: hypothetical protein JSW33_09370 [bacterium]
MKRLLKLKGALSLCVLAVVLLQPMVLLAFPSFSSKYTSTDQRFVLTWDSQNEVGILPFYITIKKLKCFQPLTIQKFENLVVQDTIEMRQTKLYPLLSPGLHLPFIVYKISLAQHNAYD